MAEIGEAHVDIHAHTDSVRNEVRDGLTKGMEGTGRLAGKKYVEEFDGESGKGMESIGSRLGSRLTAALDKAGGDAGRRFADRVRGAFSSISSQKVAGPDLDTKVIHAQIKAVEARMAMLSKMKASPRVEANMAAAIAQAYRLNAKLEEINNKNVKPNLKHFNNDLTQSLIKVSALFRALNTLTLPAAIIGAVPAIASLGQSAVQAAGALWLIPAAGMSAALGIGTLVTGFQGLGDALGPTGTPAQIEKVNEAMASLSPNARATVVELRGLSGAWTELRKSVQDRLFAGVADDIKPLAGTLLPQLRGAMGLVADGFSAATQQVIGFMRSGEGIATVGSAMNNTGIATGNLARALGPLGVALINVWAVGSGYLRQYSQGVVDLAVKFEEWVARAKASGELNRIIEQAIVVLKQLWQLASNLAGILGELFKAGQAAAGSFLQTLVMVTGKILEFLKSPEGNAGLVALFKTIHETAAALMPGLLALGSAIAKSIIVLGPVLPGIAKAFSDLIIAAEPFVVQMAKLASVILPPVISLISSMSPVLGPVIVAIGSMIAAVSGIASMIGFFTKLSDAIKLLSSLKVIWTAVTWLASAAMTALTSPIGLIVIAIAALAAGLVYAYQNSETFRNIVNGAFEAVKGAVIAVIDWFKALPETIRSAVEGAGQWFSGLYDSAVAVGVRVGEWITGLPTMISNGLTALGGIISSAASTAWEWLVTSARNAGAAVLTFLSELPGNIAYGLGFIAGVVVREGARAFWGIVDGAIAAWDATYKFFTELPGRVAAFFVALAAAVWNGAVAAWNGLTSAVGRAVVATYEFLVELPGRIGGFLSNLASVIWNASVAAWNGLTRAVGEAVVATYEFLVELPGRLGTFFANLGSSIYNWAVAAYRRWFDAIVAEWRAIQAFFESLPAKIQQFFVDAGQWLYQVGADILNGLVNGLTSAWNAVWSWIGEMVDKFIQGFKDGLGIASPSTLFAQFGTWILEGFLNGLTTMVDTILGFVTGFVDRFINGFNNLLTMFVAIWQAIYDAVSTVLDAVVTFVDTAVNNILSFVTSVMTAVFNFWKSIWDAIYAAAQALFGSVVTYITTALQNLWNFIQQTLSALRQFWESIWNAIKAFGESLWNALVAFYNSGFTNWRGLFEALMNAINAFWRTIWEAIRAFGQQIWNAIVSFFQNGFNAFRSLVESVMNAISAFWQSVWTAIRTFAETVWRAFESFINTGLNALRALFDSIMNAVRVGWEAVWNAIRNFGETAWRNFQNFINSGLTFFKSSWDAFWNGISTGFDRIWQGIQDVARRAWETLNTNFRGGINLVIDAVNWPINKINSVFGISIPTVPRLATGGTIDLEGVAGLARGGQRPGPVTGKGSTTSDSVLTKLSRDEHVWSAAEVRAAGGHDAVRRMRAQVMAGIPDTTGMSSLATAMQRARIDPDSLGQGAREGYKRRQLMDKFPKLDDVGIRMLAYGGVQPHVAAAGDAVTAALGRMPGGIGGVGARGNVSDHPIGLALDFMTMNDSGLGNRVASFLTANWYKLAVKYLIWQQRIASSPGAWRGMADRGSRTANHFDHVHASFLGRGSGDLTNLIAAIMPSFDGILNDAKNAIRGMFGGRAGWWIDLAGGFIDKAWEGMKKKATDMWNSLFAAAPVAAPAQTFDSGGWLMPGTTIAQNFTNKPEAIIADPLTAFEQSFKKIFRWLAPDLRGAIESGNGQAFDALVRKLGGEKELGKDIGRAFDRMPRWARELVREQFPTIAHALDSKEVDLVQAIRDIVVTKPVTTPPKPPVIPPVEIPKIPVPTLPTGPIGVSFQEALSQFAPELSLALKAGAGDQSRFLAQEIIGNSERLAAISAAMGADVKPILQTLVDSLRVPPVVLPPPPPPPPTLPSWLEREVERLRQYALANINKGSNAGDRLEEVGDDFSWRLVRAFEAAFPNIENAIDSSRIDVNRTLAAEATELLAWLRTRSSAEQVQILEALDGQDRSLADALRAAQAAVTVEAQPTGGGLTIESGALQVTIEGNADAVTVDQLRSTLVAWSDEILHQYEGRT